jgi:asparagine synthase (glutamine-hydrolysing)
MSIPFDLAHGELAASCGTSQIDLRGWIELGGVRLSQEEVQAHLSQDRDSVLQFGGEFFLRWSDRQGLGQECTARDHFGIMPGECPPGTLVCRGEAAGRIDPGYHEIKKENNNKEE